jgi:MarR family transcriptional regulator, organic hydroperoxide resistance regulator
MGDLVAQLEAATHRVVEGLTRDLESLGLTPGEVNALAHLQAGEPAAVAEVQAATGQRPSTLTGVIDRLERRGLVRRQVNARDRRSFVLELTSAGEAAAERVRDAFAALERRALDDVPSSAVAGFQRVLRALEDAAR